MQLNAQHQSFTALLPSKPGRGLEACRRGDPGVIGLRLKGVGPSGQLLEAHPSLLQKVNGMSRWGNFAYRPVLARQGRRLTREHRLVLSLQAFLLEQLQETPITEGITVGIQQGNLKVERIFFSKVLQRQLKEVLLKLAQDLRKEDPPPLTTDRRKCILCSWRSTCDFVAKSEGHLSEISGVGGRRLQILHELGIYKIKGLAEADPIDLANRLNNFGEQHSQIASKLIAQAKVQRIGLEERLLSGKSLPEIDNAPGVLLYDIESDPDLHDDFLHGFLHIKRNLDNSWEIRKAKYHPLLVMQEQGEYQCWKRLRKKLSSYPEWPILHYGETEKLTLCKIAKRQGASDIEIAELQKRLIDIHSRLRTYWCLPTNNYGLKAVANWLRFRWNQEHLDGARALLWWRQWRGQGEGKRGKAKILQRLFSYNQDDCLATWEVTKWLLEQDKRLTSNQRN